MYLIVEKNHIKKLALFGSFLTNDFRSDSDIDLLVEFEKGHVPGFFDLVRMQDQLSKFFNGRSVDLRTQYDLRIVYTTANEDIPPLIDEIEGILG